MKKYIFLCLSIIFSYNQIGRSQEQTNIPNIPNIPKSPEAASFVRYFELPVSFYTGTNDISIHIYTIKSDDIEVPLQLSYHNAGVKVEEESSWVGLGWNFMVGGCITRKMKGWPDEFDYITYQGMRVTNKFLDFPYWTFPIDYYCEYIECSNYNCTDYFNDDLVSYLENSSIYDFEPDEYVYSFNGNSGSFSFDVDGNIVNSKHNRLKIIPRMDYSVTPAKEYWEITDEDGNVFEFKKRQQNRYESATPTGGIDNFMYTSAWFITKITTVNGKEINFSYDLVPTKMVIGISMFSNNFNIFDNDYNLKETINENTPVYIKEITFDNGRVVFLNSGQRRDLENGFKLDKIQIYNSDELLKEFELHYNYFVATPNQYQQNLSYTIYKSRLQTVSGYTTQQVTDTMVVRSRYRLKLESVQEVSAGESKPPYEFHYNSINLPCKNSFSVDHWGYFNNAQNSNKIPSLANYITYVDHTNTFSGFYTFYYANRQPNNNAKAALLEQITYPTGGTLSIYYDLNSYQVDINKPTNLASFEPYILHNRIHEVHFDIEETQYFVTTEKDIHQNANMEVRFTFAHAGGYQECNRYAIRIDNPQGNPVFYQDIDLSSSGCYDPTPYPVTHNKNYSIGVLSSNSQYAVQLIDNYPQLDDDPYYVSIPIDVDVIFTYKQIERRTEGNGGGCRISEIQNYDPVTGQTLIKSLYYYDGKLIAPPIYARKVNVWQLVQDNNCQTRAPLERVFVSSASNTTGSNTLNGSHVGYSKVVVYSEDVNGNKINKTEYNYHNNEDTYYSSESADFGPFIPPSPDKENGLLNSKIEYDEGDQIIRKTENFYFLTKEPNNYGMRIFYKRLPYGSCEEAAGAPEIILIHIIYYKLFKERQLLTKVEVTTDGNKQTTNFFYDNSNHNNPTRTCKNTSYGGLIWTNTTYPDDFTNTTGFIGNLKNANIINKPIEVITYKSDESGNNKMILGGELYTYKTDVAKAGLTDKYYLTELSNPKLVSCFDFTSGSLHPINTIIDFNLNNKDLSYYEKASFQYNNDNKLVEVIEPANMKKAYIWGYHNTLPVAKIENAIYTEVLTNLNSSDLSSLNNASILTISQVNAITNKIRTGLPDALVTTYTYDPLIGVTSITDERNVTTYYEYDDFNRLKYIKDFEGNILKRYEYNYATE